MPSKRGLGKNGLDVMFEPVKKVVKERQAGENVRDWLLKLNLNPTSRVTLLMKKLWKNLPNRFGKAALFNPLLSAKRGEPMKLLPESAAGELPKAARGSSRFLLSSVNMMTPGNYDKSRLLKICSAQLIPGPHRRGRGAFGELRMDASRSLKKKRPNALV